MRPTTPAYPLLPGGLFRSGDFGQSWQLVDTLWNRAERAEWFGGGCDGPGIHAICAHPQHPGEPLVGISCGGVWVSQDDAAGRRLQADSPNTQDPHRIERCIGAADVRWCQHHNGIGRSKENARSWQEVRGAPVAPASRRCATGCRKRICNGL